MTALKQDAVHEALDRVYVLSRTFDDTVIDHPTIQADESAARIAGAIADAFGELYIHLGCLLATSDGPDIADMVRAFKSLNPTEEVKRKLLANIAADLEVTL